MGQHWRQHGSDLSRHATSHHLVMCSQPRQFWLQEPFLSPSGCAVAPGSTNHSATLMEAAAALVGVGPSTHQQTLSPHLWTLLPRHFYYFKPTGFPFRL